jgi:Phytanoyl-CoA dioxygenase (PhyH)
MAKKSRSRIVHESVTPKTTSIGVQPTDGLDPDEKRHLERCTMDFGRTTLSYDQFVQTAVETLEQEHMLVIQNCLDDHEIQILHDCYIDLHRKQSGQRAIGEKDASKRSGTRLYNCLCQLGPACDFYDWKDGTEKAQDCLHPRISPLEYWNAAPRRKPIWKAITDTFHFTHIARVEVVTSHIGCRAQDWHIDGVHGLTVIIPLTDVGVRQGPTELDFEPAFVGLWEGDAKVRKRSPKAERVRAVLSKGSVFLFNANVSHRGSANIGNKDRPILVLDCSLESTCLAVGGPRDIWSYCHEIGQ